MTKQSAGLVLYKFVKKELQLLLVHPGGPFWKNKNAAGWSIPKGEVEEGEDLLAAAKRETKEETGWTVTGTFIPLQPVRQKAGKTVHAWAVEGDHDEQNITSNSFELEWPPKSGKQKSFPEIDKAAWFAIPEARQKIHGYLLPVIDQLEELFASGKL